MYSKKHIIYYLGILVISILISSCYTRKEGCVELLSDNFDVFADDACTDCCTYPNLVLRFKHMVGDSTFRTDTTLINNFGQNFSILEIKYYVSDFDLYKEGQKIDIIENIYNTDKSVVVPNDMKMARNTVQDLNIGSIKNAGRFDSLSLYFGLGDNLISTTFVDLPTTHVLQNANRLKDSMDITSQMSIRLKRNLAKTDTINLFLNGDDLFFKLVIDSTIVTQPGFKPTYTIKADYLKLFENIDLHLPINEIQNQLRQNLHKFLIVK